MPSVQFSHFHIRLDPGYLVSNPSESPLVLRWEAQRKSCWDINKKLCFLDTVLRGWTCAPVYILPKGQDDCVFDGAHKIESLEEFVNGKFEIKDFHEPGWNTSPLNRGDLEGKKFVDLPIEIKRKIMNYEFTINYIPEEIAKDPEKLRILWYRLNNSGTPLNGYELDRPVYGELHDILQEISKNWTNTPIYNKADSKRGNLEENLYQLLALSEMDWDITSFPSLPGLSKRWKERHGKEISDISKKIKENENEYRERLKLMRKYLDGFMMHNAFRNGDNEIEMSQHRIPLLIFIGRAGKYFSTIQQFNIHVSKIVEKLKTEIFTKTADEVVKFMNCSSRNAKFQKSLIDYIDNYYQGLAQIQRRLFNEKEKKEVLKNQNNKCSLCNEKLLLKDSEADHIIPYSQGGSTTVDNCQMVHKHCHRNK